MGQLHGASYFQNQVPDHQTPWQEMYRGCVGQLDTGACIEFATKYRDVRGDIPRHYH